ncbi:MAG TPA: hypothetical protein VL588_08820, partial [Bdellovibrionota bacterium]|nr:hypothetical protein [Bdellovibrionota bacterium]
MVRRSTGFLALLALLSGGCDKDIKPVPEAGYVSVSVLKETVQADGSSTFVDQGGALDLTYFTASGSKRSQGATFTGLLDVPAKVIVGGKKTY